MLYPFLLEQDGQLSSHEAFEQVSSFCRLEAIPSLDTEADYLALDVDALRVHPHDYHANAEAHRVFARAVDRWLAQRGLPRARRSGEPAGTR